MSGWSIEPQIVRSVVDDVSREAGDLDGQAETLTASVDTAASTLANASTTASAVVDVAADPLLHGLAALRRYVGQVVSTVESVVTVYESGDLQMAAETQRAMPDAVR